MPTSAYRIDVRADMPDVWPAALQVLMEAAPADRPVRFRGAEFYHPTHDTQMVAWQISW